VTKPLLLLTVTAGLLAAVLAAAMFPAAPVLAVLSAYAATVGSLAHATGAPPARTIGASLLVIALAVTLTLRAARTLIDAALWLLTTSTQGALHAAKAYS
jgi:hypothetical protein